MSAYSESTMPSASRLAVDRLDLFLDPARDAFWDWHPQEDHLYLSARFKAQLGYDDQDLENSSETIFRLLHPGDRDRILTAVENHLESPRPLLEEEFRLRRKSGGYLWVQCRASTTLDSSGRPQRILGVQVELSERKRVASSMQHPNVNLARTTSDLLLYVDVISRDLNERLRNIRSNVHMLEQQCSCKHDDRARVNIELAVDGAARMTGLLDALLEYSRAGMRNARFKPTDCNLVWEQAVADLAGPIAAADAVIEAAPLPVVEADREQLVQLFRNLLDNAIKFAGSEPPRVQCSASNGPDEWLFAVRDNGVGIAAKEAEAVFEVFHRTPEADGQAGAGIGLAICKRIVERHGGRIWVEAYGGRGTTIFFTISRKSGTSDA